MPVKRYGIFIAYAPRVDLRHEGLGRWLAAFLREVGGRSGVRFVVACPSWGRESLLQLCASEGVDTESFDLVRPSGTPLLLRIYIIYRFFARRRKGRGRLALLKQRSLSLARSHAMWFAECVGNSRSLTGLILLTFYAVLLGVALLPLGALVIGVVGLRAAVVLAWVRTSRLGPVAKARRWLGSAFRNPRVNGIVVRLYRGLERNETRLMVRQINGMRDVRAWFSTTAFWPTFNEIRAPRLMCLPDVVLGDAPVGFGASPGGSRFATSLANVDESVRDGQWFTTYSAHVAAEVLGARYGVVADRVRVIPHAASSLSRWVAITGFPDVEATSLTYCRKLLSGALYKSTQAAYAAGIANTHVRFIFYASQFRPSKNILVLLRAYERLLRKRFIGHKLLLTGTPQSMPEVVDFIAVHDLGRDVICLPGLSAAELAACYRLAELAVNPSLSEGGCPFTLTEALSVGTPVVMSRIAVTLEIVDDPALREMMLFDPRDHLDVEKRILWALQNRTALLQLQRPLYDRLAQRTWRTVVDEYVDYLDAIAVQT